MTVIEFQTMPTVVLRAAGIILRDLSPILNSRVYEHFTPSVKQMEGDHVQIEYLLDGGVTFVLDVMIESSDQLKMTYAVSGLTESPDEFGVRFGAVQNLRQFLRNGYTSWDGSFYVDPEASARAGAVDNATIGFAMTQLLPRYGEGCLVLGFDRHDRFQHLFKVEMTDNGPSLTITTCWDRKQSDLTQPLCSETLAIFTHMDNEAALRQWAEIVAQKSTNPPRIPSVGIRGWCSWYNLYAYISEESILADLHGAALIRDRERLPLDVFQIDDGFTPEMGDWLDVKGQFPRGMKPLLDDIRSAGFISGLWIGPFMVGNRSTLFKQHPDWVVQDVETGKPIVQWRSYGEFRWHKQSGEYYILDVTHPDAFAYIRSVFHTWRHEWGCEYFKVDFLFYGAEYGPTRAKWHTPGFTRIEIWRIMAEMIREEIGDAQWLACGSPLWAAVGLADGIRIGGDVGVKWSGSLSAESLLRDQATRNFANGILWQTDPDCILLRDREHYLTDTEVRSLAIYAGMSGGVVMTSDSLHELSEKRIRLLRLVLGQGGEIQAARNPLLGKGSLYYTHALEESDSQQQAQRRFVAHSIDPVIIQVRPISSDAGYGCVLILNASDQAVQRTYPFSQFELPESLYSCEWDVPLPQQLKSTEISAHLAPHESVLVFVSETPFEHMPTMLS